MRALAVVVLLSVLPWKPVDAAAQDPAAAEARALYNAGRFDEAIVAAGRASSAGQPAAAVVAVRARLERFRLAGDPDDLAHARDTLQGLPVDRLSRSERIEWELGVAEALYLDGQPGPASELFDGLLSRTGEIGAEPAEHLLDWWATALDAFARRGDAVCPDGVYARIAERMEATRRRQPWSAVAAYWLAAAVRGTGDLDRAWNLAIAGWIRAPVINEGAALRVDLERLVLQGIVPDRAQRETGRATDAPETVAVMAEWAARWEATTRQWAGPAER